MPADITEARVAEIYRANNLNEARVWDLYVDARIKLRMQAGSSAQQVIIDAIKQVGDQLKIPEVESTLLYGFLYRKMCG